MRAFHADARAPGAGLAFYVAGADPPEGDRLGRLKLTTAGLRERDSRVLEQLRARRVPVALAMAGGYGHDLATTVACQVGTLEEAEQSRASWQDLAPPRGALSAVEE